MNVRNQDGRLWPNQTNGDLDSFWLRAIIRCVTVERYGNKKTFGVHPMRTRNGATASGTITTVQGRFACGGHWFHRSSEEHEVDWSNCAHPVLPTHWQLTIVNLRISQRSINSKFPFIHRRHLGLLRKWPTPRKIVKRAVFWHLAGHYS